MSRLFSSEAGESGLVVGVDGSSAAAGSAATTATAEVATEVATGTATGTTTATALTTTLATATTTLATATAGELATGTTTAATTLATVGALGRLDEAVLELDDLLRLALALALGLATGTGEEDLLLVLDEFLGAGPLLVGLGALVGLADLQGVLVLESELLLDLLGEVVGVGDGLVLLLDGSGILRGGVLGNGLLDVGLGNVLALDLVLQLGLAFGGTPRESSLLVGTTATSIVRMVKKPLESTILPGNGAAVTVIAVRGTSCATAYDIPLAPPKKS